MIVMIEKRQTLVHTLTPDGRFGCTVFNDMSEAEARRLAPQYGIDPRHIYAVEQTSFHYRRHIDGAQVAEILNRLPYAEKHTPRQLLDAVQCLVPQAVEILTFWERPGRR